MANWQLWRIRNVRHAGRIRSWAGVFAALCLAITLGGGLPHRAQAALAGGISVGAAGGWVDTGISVLAGDQLAITASGSWTADGVNFTGPNGYSQTSADNYLNTGDIGVCAFCAKAQAGHWGALIGYVGNNPPAPGSYTASSVLPRAQRVFVVGSKLASTTPLTGELWLAMNDDAYSGYTQDNSGSVAASVSVTNNPPPGESITQRVLLYIEDPTLANKGGELLSSFYGWADPVTLTNEIIGDLEQSSHGIVHYDIVGTVVDNSFPVFNDGFQYTDSTWESDWANGTPHQCPGYQTCFDYNRLIADNNMVAGINDGQYDEVWVYGDPMAGMAESTMAGDGAYWLNSNPVTGVNSSKAFVIMGWNYQRGVGEAIHSYGHRVENIMCHMYGTPPGGSCTAPYPTQNNNWGRFVTINHESPGYGGIGRVHCPVNGCETMDYDYDDMTYASSNADDWYNYPNLTGRTRQVNALDWSPDGADPQRQYLDWWYSHIPHATGRNSDGLLNDWWHYIIDVDQYKFGDAFPSTTIDSGPSGLSASTSATFAFSSDQTGSTFSCSLDGAAFSPCRNPVTFTGLSQGTHSFEVAARSYAGNTDPAPPAQTWTVDSIAPTVPEVGGSGLTRPFTVRLAMPVNWAATDTGSGVANYDVRYQSARYTSDLDASARWQSQTLSGGATWGGTPGHTYCFSARATDYAGNTSAWSRPRCAAVPVDDRGLTIAAGSWHRKTGQGFFQGTYTEGSAKGAALTLAGARARRVTIVAVTCPACGTIRVSLGSWHATYSLYSSTRKAEQLFTSAAFSSLQTGTLRIQIVSSGQTVQIDGAGISRV